MYQLIVLALSLFLIACGHRNAAPADGGATDAQVNTWTGPLFTSHDLEQRMARIGAERERLKTETAEYARPRPTPKPVPPDPRAQHCSDIAQADWNDLSRCLADIPEPKEQQGPRPVVDGGHRYGGPSPYPPVFNPSWLLPEWHFDPASRLATCSDENTCITSTHPCCTHMQIESRLGTREPRFRQTTAEFQHSSQAVNPPVDEFWLTPIVQNGAQYSFQADFVQVCSGTLSGVTQLSRAYPDVAISATLCSGLTQPTLIRDTTTGSCDMWIDTNTSGTTWTLSHYLLSGPPFVPANGASDQLCGIANGDSYVAYTPVTSNLRYWDPVLEDLADNPDSRATLYGGRLGVGINSGAGSDTAQVYIGLNGSALNEVSFSSSTNIMQTRYTHGSRAYGLMQNTFFEDTSARTTISGTGPMVPDNGSSGFPVKSIRINGGRLYLPVMQNVSLDTDVRVTNGAIASGNIVYGNVYMPNVGLKQAYVSVNGSASSGNWYGAGGNVSLSGLSVIECSSPAATHCTFAGLLIDGAFDGYALDDSTNPGRPFVHIPQLGGFGFNALDMSIAAGGCGGRCIGREGSYATVVNAIPTSPLPLFISDGGVSLFGCNTAGQQCDIVGPGAGATVSGTAPITVTGGPAYTVALTTPLTVPNGGTADSTLTSHAVLIGEGTAAVNQVGPGTSGIPLVGQGGSSDPAFSTAIVAGGGTGDTTLTSHAALLGEGTSAVAFATPSTSGQCLCSNGASSDPTFQTVAYGNLSGTPATVSVASGTGISVTGGPNPYTINLSLPVSVANGGTGDTTFSTQCIPYGNGGTGALLSTCPTGTLTFLENTGGGSFAWVRPGSPLYGSGNNVDCSPTTFVTVASVSVTTVANQTLDINADFDWNVSLGSSTSVQDTWGISIDSTTTLNNTHSMFTTISPIWGEAAAMTNSPSAGSHTVRILCKTAATVGGAPANNVIQNADLVVRTF